MTFENDDAERTSSIVRTLLLAAVVAIVCTPSDAWVMNDGITARVLGARVTLSAAMLLAAWGMRADSTSAAHFGAMQAAALMTAGSFTVLIRDSGGAVSPLFGWFVALPILLALVMSRERHVVMVLSIYVWFGAASIVIVDLAPAMACAWMFTVAVAGILAMYAADRLEGQFRSERLAVERRVAAERQLEAAEKRHEEAARLAHLQRLAVIGGMTAGVAHEINNPLTMISLSLDTMVMPGTTAERAAAAIEDCHRAIERMSFVVQDLSRASRKIDGGESTCSVEARALEAVRVTHSRWQHRAVIDVHIDPDLPAVCINGTRLVQVLTNLILNAVDASDKGMLQIEITARAEGQIVVVLFSDDGPGIPTALEERVFEPFFTTKAEDEGTGLGLALCRNYLRAVGGDIRLQNDAIGASFALTIPAAEQKRPARLTDEPPNLPPH